MVDSKKQENAKNKDGEQPKVIYHAHEWTHPAVVVCVSIFMLVWYIFAFIAPHPPCPTFTLHSPRFKLKNDVYLASTELSALQDQLEHRMTLHNDIMSASLANFTTILTELTDEAELFDEHFVLFQKLINMGTGNSDGSSFESWGEAAQHLADATLKLDTANKSDKQGMAMAINDTVRSMAVELKDMETFMQEMSSAVDVLLKALDSYPDPLKQSEDHDVQLQESPLQWSWDEITADRHVRRSVGTFTRLQKEMLTVYLASGNISHHAVLTYGLGAADTFPHQSDQTSSSTPSSPHSTPPFGYFHSSARNGKHNTLAIRSTRNLFLPTEDGKYICEIVINYDQETVFRSYWFTSLVRGSHLERRLVSVESMRCGTEGEDLVDVVRGY